MDEDEMMMLALEAGASDMQPQEDCFEIYTEVGDFSTVREALEKGRLHVPFRRADAYPAKHDFRRRSRDA